MARTPAWPRASEGFLVACALLAGGTGSLLSNQDLNFDQQHYHYYLGWSLLARRLDQDIAPAGFGSFLNPVIHVFTYLGITHLPPRLFGLALGALHGLNGYLVYRLARLVLAGAPTERALSVITAVVALRGAAAVSLLGTTFADNLVSIPAVAALVVCLEAPGAVSGRRAALAGMLAGGAAGLKLTYGLFLVPLGGLVIVDVLRRRTPRPALAFGLGLLAGLSLAGGYWGLELWTRLGNPVFPFMNDVFHSPYFGNRGFRDPRWQAGSWLGLLTLPLEMAVGRTGHLQEVPFREARYFVIVALMGFALLRALSPGPGRGRWLPAATAVAVYLGSAFILWFAGLHYYRYFVAGEFLAPVVIVALLRLALPSRLILSWGALATVLVLSSTSGDWGRARWMDDWYRVRMPADAVPSGSIVLVGGGQLSYLLPKFPSGTRFFGLLQGQTEGFHGLIARELRRHRRPVLLLTRSDDPTPAPLEDFGLERTGECTRIRARPGTRADLCRLSLSGKDPSPVDSPRASEQLPRVPAHSALSAHRGSL